MLPTFEHPPVPPAAHAHPAWAPTPAPGPLRAARVLVGVQIGLWAAGAALGLVLAAFASTGLDDGDEAAGWAGLGVFLGLALAVLCAVATVLLAVPALLLRDRRPGSKHGALVMLCVAQGITAVPALVMVSWVPGSGGLIGAVAPIGALMLAVTVITLALQPACRAWAARSASRG